MQTTRTRRTAAVIVGAILVAVVAVGAVSLAGSSNSNSNSPGNAKKSAAPRAAASGGVVDVRLTDFKIAPAVSSVSAGKVTFVATNAGKTPREISARQREACACAWP